MTDRSALLDTRQTALWLLVGLALVVLVRVWVPYDEVFRDGAVVLAGNDPYSYRYWIEQLLASGRSPFNPFDLAQLPDELHRHDVMFIWAMWIFAELLGGSVRAGGLALAWYPVLSALVTAVLIFAMTLLLTEDRRVAVLAVVLLALTPAHAFRTMLGFADHHAFDYIALALTATALVWLETREISWFGSFRQRLEWSIVVLVLGGALAAQTLAWRGGPILMIPVGLYVIAGTVSSVHAQRSPTASHIGLIAGLVIASMLAMFIHLAPNWTPAYRGFAPFVLFGFVAWVLGIGELAYVRGTSWFDATIGMPVAVGGWFLSVMILSPSLLLPLNRFAQFLDDASLKQTGGIGETFSLVGGADQPLLLFGLLLVVAIPAMAWVANEVRIHHRPGWLVASAYAWYFLALSINRIRFTGQLALFTAVFGALGLVWLAGRIEQATPLELFDTRDDWRLPDWQSPEASDPLRVLVALSLLVLLVVGVGVAQMPSTMGQITVDDSTYAAATWMAEDSTDRGWDYPRNYVFSEWGSNRVYNYHVSGESRSYSYAQRNYRSFVSSSEPGAWYEALAGGTGFVVVRSSSFAYPSDSMQVRLFERHSSAGDGVRGLAHYRLVYVAGDGGLKVFTLVPGATIVGTGTPNSILPVSTDVRIGQDTFTYRRNVRTDSEGRFSVTVPYPGEYAVGSVEVTVSDTNVTGGDTIRTQDG